MLVNYQKSESKFYKSVDASLFHSQGRCQGVDWVDISLDLASPLFIARNGVLDDEMNEKNEK